ncbi:MAG: right-handed parallel beta-helix repeat-containing protein [Pseudomonadota bacterium]
MSPRLLLVLLALAACNDQGLTTHNAKPEVNIVHPSDGEQVEEGPFTLMGTADDADDPNGGLLATWSSAERTLCEDMAVGDDGTTSCEVALGVDDTEITLAVTDPHGASGSDHVSITVLPTGAPHVTLSAPAADGVYYSDALIAFEGLVDDDEDDPTDLTVGVDSSRDGALDIDLDVVSDGTVSGWGNLSQGEHALTLWAEDSDGKRGSDSVVIDVGPPNSDPTCAITAPESGSTVELGDVTLFEAAVDDVDIPENRLEVSWTSDRDGPLGTSTPSSSGAVVFSTAALSAATHVITLNVADEADGTCTDFIVLTVGSAPSITLNAPAWGDLVDEGEDLAFDAQVADTEDSATALSLSWESDVDGVFSTAGADSSGRVRFAVDDLSVGDHTITGRVTDTDGMSSIATVDVVVNGRPSAPVVSLGPTAPDTADALTVRIDAASVDPEGGAVTYSYAWLLDGVSSAASTSATLPASATTRGDVWTARVTPSDGRVSGAYGEASLSIGNAAPSVSGVVISPASPGADDTLSCAYTFSDPDGDTDRSSIAWTVDGVAAGTGGSLAGAFSTGDVVACIVTPSDGTDTGTAASASATIGNTAPSVSGVQISPDPASTLSTLTCSYTFSDADGDTDHSTIAWAVGGVSAGSGTTLAAGSASKGQVVACTVTPNDGASSGTPVADTLTIGNAGPTLSAVSLTPSSATTDTLLTASVSASDPDGDTLTPSYTWYVDGVAVAATGSTLSGATWFDKGQRVHVAATVSDGSASSSSLSSSAITILNTAPGAPTVSIAPSGATAGQALTCVVGSAATDADGDAVTYRMTWTRGGVAYAGPSTTTWSGDTVPASVTTAAEVWACTATPNDGTVDGSTAGASVTIGISNTPPVVDSLSLTPTTVRTDTTLNTHVSTSDADGDTVTVSYAWYVDGSLISATGSTLSGATWFDKDQQVYVVATPNDGHVDGSPVTSSTVTVLNTTPGAPSVAISPASPIEAVDALLCQVTAASSDTDGDAVTYAMTWTRSGSAYAGASTTTWPGDTVPASATSAGEAWVCTVTPNDGDGAGTTATASVTIGSGNHAPSITALTLTPSTVRTDGTLTASATTSDADGDPVTVSYAWYVDGALSSATGSTLSGATWFDKDEVVYVIGTPNDGTVDGTPVSSSSVTVLNTAPGAPTVAISPTAPEEAVDELVCGITAASSDADGDSVTYVMTWTRSGSAFTGTSTTTWPGDTVPASATTAGEVWVCTATPDDGDDYGATATASVTILAAGCPLYVDASVPPGGTGGYSDPLPNIAYGLAYAASTSCGTVVLKPGTYNETVDFNGQAVTITSELGPAVTIIHPTAGGNVVTFDSGETASSVLDSVTVSGGTSHGVYINGSDPTITGCIITGNRGSNGAGVSATNFDGLFQGNEVSANTATSSGGGMYVYGGTAEIDANWFEANTAPSGAGLWLNASALVSNNVILDSVGHGLYLDAASTSVRDNSTVAHNTIVDATSYGVYIDYYYTSSTYYFPIGDFVDNIVYSSGSYDVYSSVTTSNPFSSLYWYNNNVYGGSGYNGNSQTATHGNIAQNPRFTDAAGDDFSLAWGSLCIDTGLNSSTWGVTGDYDGEARTQGPAEDLGAFEYAGPTDDCDGVDDGAQCATTCPVYVDPTATPGGDGGVSDPYPTIRYAQAYRGSCDEIVLGPGTYDEPLDFDGEDLYVHSSAGAPSTILDPSVGLNVVTFDSVETEDAILEGVTVTGGTTHGVYISNADPTILDCIVTGNAGSTGAGVYAASYDGLFQGNEVSHNTASSSGGGLYLYGGTAEIDANWFEANTASSGAGLWLNAAALVSNNVILDSVGQGVYLDAASTSSRDNSTVVHNTIVDATSYGVYIDYYYTSSTYYFPIGDFVDNIVYSSGSYDVYSSVTTSNPFSSVYWYNNDVYGGSGYNGNSQTATHGNIAQNPRFTDAAGDDFSLAWGSLCIDTGLSSATWGLTGDYDGEARAQGPLEDMGAFEYAGPTDDCDGIDDGSQCALSCPVYVDPTVSPGGNGDAADPYHMIRYAQAYRGSCDEIILDPGTYDEPLDFDGEDLYIHSSAGAASTILDPSVGLNVVTFDSAETEYAILEGVTVTGGTTHGIYINNADPTILDCIITGNTGSSGAGVYAASYDGLFQGNVVSSNTASSSGGGLYLYSGAAEIDANWFDTNTASSGAGLWLNATALVSNNVILDSVGQGIYLDAASSSSRDNSSVVNNTIADASSYGVYIDYYYTSSTYYFPVGDFLNNIVYSSGSYDVYSSVTTSSPFTSLYWYNNDVYAGSGYNTSAQTGTHGNVSQNPNFTNEPAEDYSLAWPSAWCIDQGLSASTYGVSTDYNGRARPQGLGFDIGAYESY